MPGRRDAQRGAPEPAPAPGAVNGFAVANLPTAAAPGTPALAAMRAGRHTASAGTASGAADRELLAKRDRLIERFAAMQLDLGGVYYEMAIRDHINPEVLIRKAAEMQRVDAELRQLEGVLASGGSHAQRCAACEAPHPPAAAFCSRCGSPLSAAAPGPMR